MTIAIVTNSKNRNKINQAIVLATLESSIGIPLKDVHLAKGLNSVPIYYDDTLEDKGWTGRWIRTDTLPDDKVFTWVDNMESPPSWAIYFGLVEKEYEYVYKLVDTATLSVTTVSEKDVLGSFDAAKIRRIK